MVWDGRPYHSLDYEMKLMFGCKVYKLALDGGMSCPNRDGTIGSRGCSFCSLGGSGDFAESRQSYGSVGEQIEAAKARVAGKIGKHGRYIAYFQSFTNTYAPVDYLEEIFTEAICHPDVAVLSIATRPDCLPPETVSLLSRLSRIKPVWIELGLQTIHETTAERIRRGYSLPVFEEAYRALKACSIPVIAHTIIGLPGETKEMMADTVRYLGEIGGCGIDGIKLQLLHVLEGTDLAEEYKKGLVPVLSLDEYADLVVDLIALLPPDTVIHRISGDGPKNQLLAPLWSGNKRLVLNTITRRFKERGITQGEWFHSHQS